MTDGTGRYIIDRKGAVVATLPFAGAEGMASSEWFSEGLMVVDRVMETVASPDTGGAPGIEDAEGPGLVAGEPLIKMGYVDKSGAVVIDFIFEDAGPFVEGLAPVKVDGKWGYIKNS